MVPVKGTLTTDFMEMRPVDNPTHIHGAEDWGADLGSPIVAPEAGTVMAWAAFRPDDSEGWPKSVWLGNEAFPWRNYFYDTYGALLIVRTPDRVHVIAHCNIMPTFSYGWMFSKVFIYQEEGKKRFPMTAMYTAPIECRKGATIGYVGDEGQSSGPHVHWEIHRGWKWERWEDRLRPGEYR